MSKNILRPLSGKAWGLDGKADNLPETNIQSPLHEADEEAEEQVVVEPVDDQQVEDIENQHDEDQENEQEETHLEEDSKDMDYFDKEDNPDQGIDDDSEDEYSSDNFTTDLKTTVEESAPIDAFDIEQAEKQVEEMWAGKSNVLVAVRVRPMNLKEVENTKNVVNVLDQRIVCVTDKIENDKKRHQEDVLRKNRPKEKKYAFDFAFGPDIATKTVYNHTTKFLIDGVIIGYNATVFAYGATGAGKTHTMLGGEDENGVEPGIMQIALKDLFAKINDRQSAMNQDPASEEEKPGSSQSRRSDKKKSGRDYKVTCSFLEVYNEMIRDLLTPSSEYLDLREDPVKGPCVTGLSEVEANSAEDIMALLRKGNSRRTTEGTAANQASSRSHAVLQINVERRDFDGNTAVSNVTIGKLSLIDLAGSERASVTQNRGQRLLEGANINRSLLALGNCINALREGGKGAFVPYRDSKLTRLLKDSLGGNCRTVMLAAASPAKNQMEETLNTLKYANRAKNIKTQVERNVLNVDYHDSEYVNLIGKLKSEISNLRNQLKRPPANPHQRHQQQMVQEQIRLHEETLQQQLLNSKGPKSEEENPRNNVEQKQMVLLRQQVILNFKERMQLSRSLIEIEAQNIQNDAELAMHHSVIQRFECSLVAQKQPDGEENGDMNAKQENEESASSISSKPISKLSVITEPPGVKSARIESQQLVRANAKNTQLKQDIERRLAANENSSAALRHQMQTRITSDERRELMELEYRIGMLELENMELERSRMLHRSSMAHKDMLIKRLLEQLTVRDEIIDTQKNLLEENGVGVSTMDRALQQHSSGLESLLVLKQLPIGFMPGTPMAYLRSTKSSPSVATASDIADGSLRSTIYGLPSPGKQVFPMHQLEEELCRIELSEAPPRHHRNNVGSKRSFPRQHSNILVQASSHKRSHPYLRQSTLNKKLDPKSFKAKSSRIEEVHGLQGEKMMPLNAKLKLVTSRKTKGNQWMAKMRKPNKRLHGTSPTNRAKPPKQPATAEDKSKQNVNGILLPPIAKKQYLHECKKVQPTHGSQQCDQEEEEEEADEPVIFAPSPPPAAASMFSTVQDDNHDKKNVLSRLNSKIASRDHEQEPTSPFNEEEAEQRKADKKEKKKMEKHWAELSFVLRKEISSEEDMNRIRDIAKNSIDFLDQLDKKASQLNVLRGTLSRLLLPYSEESAAAEQRATTPVTGDSPLDSVMDFETRRQMVNRANDLRSLVRVKIADDADLDQARTAVTDVKKFFDKLETYATEKNSSVYEMLAAFKQR